MSEGVDYAFDKPSAMALRQAGKVFACRYAGAGTMDKWLTRTELRGLSDHGITVVANVEGTSGGLRGGYQVGRAWALEADRRFHALGMPANRPIYLSADWDVQGSETPLLLDALKGAADTIGRRRVGIYGGRFAVGQAQASGDCAWFWQTYAWSGRPVDWLPGVHIQQYRNGVQIGGADCDLNRSMVQDFGQWFPDWRDDVMPDINPATDTHLWRMAQRIEALCGLLDPNNADERMPIVALLKALQGPGEPVPIRIDTGDVEALADALTSKLRDAFVDILSRMDITVRPRG